MNSLIEFEVPKEGLSAISGEVISLPEEDLAYMPITEILGKMLKGAKYREVGDAMVEMGVLTIHPTMKTVKYMPTEEHKHFFINTQGNTWGVLLSKRDEFNSTFAPKVLLQVMNKRNADAIKSDYARQAELLTKSLEEYVTNHGQSPSAEWVKSKKKEIRKAIDNE